MPETALFQLGRFRLHSGEHVRWKIECDALTEDDLAALALMLKERVQPFGSVIGVPGGGFPLAKALRKYRTAGPLLIVDDVLTTGASMEEVRHATIPGWHGATAIGAVLFARGPCPEWITPVFTLAAPYSPSRPR